MMKKLLALCLALAFMLSTTAALAETGTATAKGFGGDVTVTLTAKNGLLAEVTITGDAETPGIGGAAMDSLAETMIKKNTVAVDAVAGATITSDAVLAAAAQALAQTGVELAAVAQEAAEVETELTCDVLVLGGGGAGIAAAMAADEAGKDVILLEKLAVMGGNTALSGGVFTRGAVEGDPEGTMTADELFDFYMAATQGLADEVVIRTYVDRAADTLAWAHAMGSGVQGTQRYLTNPETIMAVQAVGSGSGLMNPMIEGVLASNVDVYMQTSGTELIYEDGKVTGAKAVNADGVEITIHAGAVIIATGGFPSSPELLAKYSSLGAERAYSLCSPGTVGDGLVMAEAIGADVKFGPNWDNIGSNSQLTGAYIVGFPQIYSLLINDKGERFIAEDQQRPQIYQTMLFEIADGANGFFFLFDKNTIGPGVEAFIEQGECFTADTLEELADLIGVPKDALLATAEAYNANKGAEDPAFGKQSKYMAGLSEAPFYAAKTWPTRTSTIGGLVTDEKAQVLDAQGNVIPGLYAAGEVANYSFFYNIYATCGSAVGHAITYGRIAGEQASVYVK